MTTTMLANVTGLITDLTPLHIEVRGTKFLYPPTFLNIHDINETHKHVGLYYIAKANCRWIMVLTSSTMQAMLTLY